MAVALATGSQPAGMALVARVAVVWWRMRARRRRAGQAGQAAGQAAAQYQGHGLCCHGHVNIPTCIVLHFPVGRVWPPLGHLGNTTYRVKSIYPIFGLVFPESLQLD